mmetsp:Transcript_4291/g.15011  ORF Transcript_4291/g.15011 Transcript_4291/m.15011 type:complete len:240 (-) Transcript_4291:82-801(-)|eukprot:CAMPEP_0183790890 /NCGR_PEP_ID=MMETSP0803_2-20130417/1447_1 /TAXON_ID=195967 /ORGANISM="Crustomastix stigmata, Strain CCMP3273" /LENGTH=239 /DNA_ID=CAMNT_0026035167 /DNA_START=172 /DNA_END=891 /DNA_ORIENTATION=-
MGEYVDLAGMAQMHAAQQAQMAMEQQLYNMAKAIEDSVDEQIHKMENLDEDDLENLRRKRLESMRHQADKKKQWLQRGHGEYREIFTEKEFFAEMKGEERMVCHFYRENWPCKVMDMHLDLLSKKHVETKFVKIHAEKSPYLTEKLNIWMLPTLALIKSEKVIDYVCGFNEFGGTDDFPTEYLRCRLAQQALINYEGGDDDDARKMPKQGGGEGGGSGRSVRQGGKPVLGSDDEDSDFD